MLVVQKSALEEHVQADRLNHAFLNDRIGRVTVVHVFLKQLVDQGVFFGNKSLRF